MKTRAFLLILLALTLCFSLVACGDKAVTKIEITEGLALSCEVGTTYDFSTVKAKVTYNDDSVVEVTGADLTFGELDTSTVGTKVLSITYDGFTASIDIKVYGTTISGGAGDGDGGNSGDGGVSFLFGVEMPDALAAYETNRDKFTDKTAAYAVGDDNPFTFRLKLNLLDDNDQWISSVSRYDSVSKVYLVEGTTETEVGTDYVTVDETNNTFDFTDAAVGKSFRIQTRPAQGDEADCTRSLAVRVVNGYNVTEAKELNLMTNNDTTMHEQYTGTSMQNQLAKAFIDQHYGQGYYDTYGSNSLAGLVLHCDLAPTVNDIPADYLVDNGDGTKAFDDSFAVYDRLIYLASGGFTVYGNHFTLNTSALPMMSNLESIVGTRVSSNSSVFRFGDSWETRGSVAGMQSFDYTQFPCCLENLAMRDDDPNSNNEAENARHMRGLNALFFEHVNGKVDNSIVEAYTISAVMSHGNSKLTIEDSKLFNAWQNQVYAWGNNFLQEGAGSEYEDMAPWANTKPLELDIKNSSLTKCGGPVILAMNANTKPYNAISGLTVTADTASKLESYVTGEEAWFTAFPFAAGYINQMKTISGAISNTAVNHYSTTASLTTTLEGNGDTQFMNLVFAALDGSKIKYTVNGTVMMDNSDAVVTAHMSGALNSAPLLQSTVNPAAVATNLAGQMGDPADKVIDPNSALKFDNGYPEYNSAALTNINPTFFTGDYLNFHYGAVSVFMGYYH